MEINHTCTRVCTKIQELVYVAPGGAKCTCLQQVKGVAVLVCAAQLHAELMAGLLQDAALIEHVLNLLALHYWRLVHDLRACVRMYVCVYECVCV